MNSFEVLDVMVSISDGSAIVSVSGELDPFSAPQLRGAVDAALRPGVREVALDLARVTFIDARGFDAVTEAGERVRASGRAFAIRRRSIQVVRIEQLVDGLEPGPVASLAAQAVGPVAVRVS
jgi:anti-sigma B factor antagonist